MQKHYHTLYTVKPHWDDQTLCGECVTIVQVREIANNLIDGDCHYERSDTVKIVRQFVDRLKISELLIVVDQSSDLLTTELFDHPRIRVIHIPYWLYRTYDYHYRYNHDHNTNLTLSERFLFMPGKIYKEHRMKAISQLYHSELMTEHHGDWSLIIPEESEHLETTLSLAQQHCITRQELESLQRKLDYDLDLHLGSHGFAALGMPYDVGIYQRAGFVILTETVGCARFLQSAHSAWLTEKTFLCIINHRPFLAINPEPINSRLREMGFYTFDDYHEPCDGGEGYCNGNIAQAVYQFRSNMVEHGDEIRHRLLHNHNTAIQLFNRAKQQTDNIIVNDLGTISSLTDYLDRWRYKNLINQSAGHGSDYKYE